MKRSGAEFGGSGNEFATITKLFFDLVKIDSPSGHEQEVAEYLKEWLTRHGFSWKQDDVGNLYSRREGVGEPRLFCAHMDTVQGDDQSVKPQVIDGIIVSDGTTILGADNKAAIAAILMGVDRYLQETEYPRPIELVFPVKEETGGGIENMPVEWIQANSGFIFDLAKPLGGINLASPNIINYDIEILGRSAHPSRPEEGLNVGPQVAKFLNHFPQGKLDDNRTTMNVGRVAFERDGDKGVAKYNVIPGYAKISGEVRSYDEQLLQSWLEKLTKFTAEALSSDGFVSSITTNGFCPGYEFSENEPVIQQAIAASKQLDLPVKFYRLPAISDSNPLTGMGKRVVTLGDGVKDAHNYAESISQKDLLSLSALVVALLGLETGN